VEEEEEAQEDIMEAEDTTAVEEGIMEDQEAEDMVGQEAGERREGASCERLERTSYTAACVL